MKTIIQNTKSCVKEGMIDDLKTLPAAFGVSGWDIPLQAHIASWAVLAVFLCKKLYQGSIYIKGTYDMWRKDRQTNLKEDQLPCQQTTLSNKLQIPGKPK